jgi:hypothetical protein
MHGTWTHTIRQRDNGNKKEQEMSKKKTGAGYNPNRDKNGQFATGAKLPVDPENLRLIAQALPLNTDGTREEFNASVAASRAAFELVLHQKTKKYHAENPPPEPPPAPTVPYVEPEPVEFTYEEAKAFGRIPLKEKLAGDYNYQHYRAYSAAMRQREKDNTAMFETNSLLVTYVHDCWDENCEGGDNCGGYRNTKDTYDYLITGQLAHRIRERTGTDENVDVHIIEHRDATYYSEETGSDISREITLSLSNGYTIPILASEYGSVVVALEYWFTTEGEEESIYKPYAVEVNE